MYQQARRWLHAGVFEAIAHDLRISVCTEGPRADPSAAVMNVRALQSTPRERWARGLSWTQEETRLEGPCRFDTLGNPLSVISTAANEQERDVVDALEESISELTHGRVQPAYVDQGFTGERAADAEAEYELELEVGKHTEAKNGLVFLP